MSNNKIIPRYIIEKGDTYHLLLDHEISYVSSQDSRGIIHLSNGEAIPSSSQFERLEEKLDPLVFKLLAEKIIVNIEQIKKIHDGVLYMLNGSKIYVGKKCKGRLLDDLVHI